MKKFFSALLVSAMLFAMGAVAAPIAPANAYPLSDTPLAEYGSISFAELIRAVIVAYDGTELPVLMDVHYATPYINRATQLGIVPHSVNSDVSKWNENASRETLNSILASVATIKDADMKKIVTSVNSLLVNKIMINGQEVKASVSHMNGSIMLPVRAISEALGYKVSWDQSTYTASVSTSKIQSNVIIGHNLYSYFSIIAIGMSAPSPMASAPILRDGTTLVPLDFFNLMATATMENGVLTISAK